MAALNKIGAAFEALRECACAVERGDLSRADLSMKRALDLADYTNERLVRYFAQALARRAYRLLPKYPPDFIKSYFDDGQYYASRPAKLIQRDIIGKAVLSGKSKLHLISFSLNCFDQETYCYMRQLKSSLSLKITLIDTSNSGYITIGFDREFDSNLIKRAWGIEFEFNRVVFSNNSLDELEVSRLKIDRDDEFVVVNCFFLLAYMLPVALNKFLLMLRNDINPDIFYLVEYDANLNQDDFLQRFDESLQHYSNLSTFIDGYCIYGKNMVHHLRDEISNVVACEGGARMVRHMTSDQWRDSLNKFGFSSIPILYDKERIDDDDDDDFKIENGCMKISRKGQERPLYFFSAWKIKESSFVKDFYDNSLDGDHNFQNLPISPDPQQHRSLIRMASLAEIHDMPCQKLKGYHVEEILVWGKCEDNHNYGRSSQLNPCLCIVDQIGSRGCTNKIPKYHLQKRNYVSKTFESNQPCFVPDTTYEEKGLSIYCADCFVNGAFAIKLNSRHANCEGYVVVFLFDFPNGMVDEERRRVMDKILCNLRSEKSYFVTCSTSDDFLDKLEATPDVVRIIDNPSAQSQSHNNVMDMNVPLLQLLHGSSTPNAMPASHQNDLLDSSTAELLNQNEVSIKGKGKIKPKAPSTSKKKKSLIWHHVQTEKDKDGKVLSVKCNYFERKKEYCPKQGTTVWKNHLVRIHKDEWENIEKSALKLPQMIAAESSKKHKKEGSRAKDPSNEVRTGVPSRRIVITDDDDADDDDEWIASPAHDISEETETALVKGNNWSFDEQSDRENLNGWKFENHEFESYPSEKVVFTADDIAAGSKPWENALVGYVLGLNPTLAEMACFAKKQWGNLEVPKVRPMDGGVFLFDFEFPDKKRIVWESQWAYSGHLLVLRKWTSDLDVHNVERVPIWVEFPKLPLFLWNPKSLGRLAGHLGRPLATDKSTKNRNQLKCARVLIEVEVDTMDILIVEALSIPVDLPSKSFNQPVVFDRESVQNSFIASKKAGGTTVVGAEASSSHGSKGSAKEMEEPISTWSKEDVRNYLIFPFTSEELTHLERWKKHEPIWGIINTMGTIEVKDCLACLVPSQEEYTLDKLYINDTVMDLYFELLEKRCDMYPNKYLKHYSFSCLMAKNIFEGNANIPKRFKLENLNGVRKLFLPLRLPEISHWVLFYANLWDRQLLWLDPVKDFQKSHEKEMKIISDWFRGKLLPHLGYNDASNWEEKVQEDIPTQENDFDCGVFVMKYADCLAHGDHFPFTQDDMIHFRERIFLDLTKFWT